MTAASGADDRRPVLALLAGMDRFEDFYERIGVSLETFRTQLTGGWLLNYVEALRAAGVDTVLCFASAAVDAPARFTHEPTGATIWILPSPWLHRAVRRARERWAADSVLLATIASYLATPVRALARMLRAEACDAVLCQEYESARFDVAVVLGRVLRVPILATYQGGVESTGRFERSIRAFSVRRAAGLIVGAGIEIDRLRSRYRIRPDRVAHIPNPIDADAWRPLDRVTVRRDLGISKDARVVEWHGHAQVVRKGLDVLLDAWDRICTERPDADFVLLLVGSGRNTGVLRKRVDANARIVWIDRFVLDPNELRRYVSAADVYVLASRHEGFAVAPLEAMAAGLPVVATNVSGVGDLFPDGEAAGGVVVPAEDADALANALLRLLDDPGRARDVGALGTRRVEREYSLDVVGRRLRDFIFEGR